MKAFHLAAGGGVVRGGVDLGDSEAAQFVFKAVAPALAPGEPGGEDHAVVGEGGRRNPVFFTGFAEFGQNDRSGDAAVRGDRQRVAGMVVNPVEDLHVSAIGEPPVGEVGLPALVGLLGGKPDIRGLWAPLWCRCHQACGAQVPVDRVHRHDQAVMVL